MADDRPRSATAALQLPYRVASMYAAMFFVLGVSLPFLPVWLAARGSSAVEIAVLSMVPSLIRSLAAPAVGWEADRRQAHRSLIIALSVLHLAAWVLLWSGSGFVIALVALTGVAIANTMVPLVESIAMHGVRAQGSDYGRMRLWGSASFVVANLVAGWLASRAGAGSLIGLMLAGAGATLVVSALLQQPEGPRTDRAGPTAVPPASKPPASMTRASKPGPSMTLAGVSAVLAAPLMPTAMLAAAALQGAHGMYYTYGTLHWQAQGFDPGWFGVLWAVGLITEILLFWQSGKAIARLGATGLLMLGAVLSMLRWTAMAFDPPLVVLVPLQMLHGLTYGASHLGVMHVLARITAQDKAATAQALYALASTLGLMVATAVAAETYPLFGGATYLVMAAMAAVGLAAALVIGRRLHPDSGEFQAQGTLDDAQS